MMTIYKVVRMSEGKEEIIAKFRSFVKCAKLIMDMAEGRIIEITTRDEQPFYKVMPLHNETGWEIYTIQKA